VQSLRPDLRSAARAEVKQVIERNLAALEGVLPARRGSQALHHTRRSIVVGQQRSSAAPRWDY
jgi:hypothetical protein